MNRAKLVEISGLLGQIELPNVKNDCKVIRTESSIDISSEVSPNTSFMVIKCIYGLLGMKNFKTVTLIKSITKMPIKYKTGAIIMSIKKRERYFSICWAGSIRAEILEDFEASELNMLLAHQQTQTNSPNKNIDCSLDHIGS